MTGTQRAETPASLEAQGAAFQNGPLRFLEEGNAQTLHLELWPDQTLQTGKPLPIATRSEEIASSPQVSADSLFVRGPGFIRGLALTMTTGSSLALAVLVRVTCKGYSRMWTAGFSWGVTMGSSLAHPMKAGHQRRPTSPLPAP